MKKILISLLLIVTTVMSANAMSKYRASREARFLTDKMAWELDLSPMQMEDVYEINYDYFRSLVDVNRVYTREYDIRNEELKFVLTQWQWERFISREYFLIPVRVLSYAWHFPIYTFYHSDRYYYDAPHAYSHYRGTHAYNREYYRGRTEIHQGGHGRGDDSPQKPNHGGDKADKWKPNQGGNKADKGKPNQGGNKADKGNTNQGGSRNEGNAAPSRTTTNRSGSVNRNQNNSSRSGNNNSTTSRPTRSQNSNNRETQNTGSSHSATSGRR